MKIAIPCMTSSTAADVSIQFGRAPYFYVYDLVSEAGEFMENTAIRSPGGAGVKAADLVLNNKVDIVVALEVGENAMRVLLQAPVRMLSSLGKTVESDIDAFKKGLLTEKKLG